MTQSPESLREAYARVSAECGIKDFLSMYLARIETIEADRNEEAFFQRMSEPRATSTDELIESIKRVHSLVISLFDSFEQVATHPQKPEHFVTAQRALHLYLFSLLNRCGVECQKLIESTPGFFDADGPVEYAKAMQRKMKLSKVDQSILALNWAQHDEEICMNIIQGYWTIQVFGPDTNDGVCFLVRDQKKDPAFTCEHLLCTDRNLIISKYFFFFRIIYFLRFLEIFTRVATAERGINSSTAEPEVIEIPKFGSFQLVAEDFFSRSNAE